MSQSPLPSLIFSERRYPENSRSQKQARSVNTAAVRNPCGPLILVIPAAALTMSS